MTKELKRPGCRPFFLEGGRRVLEDFRLEVKLLISDKYSEKGLSGPTVYL